jgi:hypothetical protein
MDVIGAQHRAREEDSSSSPENRERPMRGASEVTVEIARLASLDPT